MSPHEVRIGLIADTHEADDPVTLIDLLAAERCDLNVHLGDVGSAPLVTRLVRAYKRTTTWYEAFTPEQRARYDANIARGLRGVRAYLDAHLTDDPTLREARERDTIASYESTIEAFRALSEPHVIRGNVDTYWIGHERVRRIFTGGGITLHEEATTLDLGPGALVLWPSARTDPASRREVERRTRRLSRDLRGRERVVVAGHEQIFRGPIPAAYQRNVDAAGLAPTTIPHYAPGAHRDCLLALARALAPESDLALISGHIHDPVEVLGAGAPLLRRRAEPGLEYRLYGLGGRPGPHPAGGRLAARLFPVAVDEIGIVTISADGVTFDVIRPAGAGGPRRLRAG